MLLLFVFLSAGKPEAQTSLNIDLLAHWKQDSLITNSSKVRYGDCFGFVWSGREYAVAGSTEGTHVFEITANNTFVPKGFIKGRFSNSTVLHRDFAVYQNYLYAVCDEGVSSLQIIDLSYLPDSIHLAREDSLLFGRVHNIFIDPGPGLFYSCIHRSTTSTGTIDAPLKVFSLADPLNLTELWSGPDDIPEVHDIYVRDGKAILNCGFDGLRVYNFAPDPSNPAFLDSKTVYGDQGYNHQGWLSPSGKTYVFADETNGKRVKKCSFNGSIVSIQQYFGTNSANGSIPHNIMCTDTFAFVAYYNEGLRIFDLRYNQPLEIAHYDSYPDDHPFKMNGNWGVYALLPSQRILISDAQYGLFLLGFNRDVFSIRTDDEAFIIYPNPMTEAEPAIVRLPVDVTDFTWKLYDHAGRLTGNGAVPESNFFTLENIPAAGMYRLRITYVNYIGHEVDEDLKVIVL